MWKVTPARFNARATEAAWGAGDLLHRHRLAHPLQTAHADTASVAQMAQ
ncbi:hypothetical protein BBM0121_00920 [Bifidobacterium breve MCC 0121]|nr:hypothetical protein BBM0121_00920 [Bifidobacterium breve MCC 0121]